MKILIQIYLCLCMMIRITINLIRDSKKIESFQIEGNKSDKEALVRLVLDGIARAMKGLELELVKKAPLGLSE